MAGARAEIRDKGGAGAKKNNFGSATLRYYHMFSTFTVQGSAQCRIAHDLVPGEAQGGGRGEVAVQYTGMRCTVGGRGGARVGEALPFPPL